MTKPASPLPKDAESDLLLLPQDGFGLVTLRGASPLAVQLLPSGAVYAVRHGVTLVNQVLPGPAEQGLFRLLLREHDSAADESPRIVRTASLLGPGIAFAHQDASATWTTTLDVVPNGRAEALGCMTTLQVHPRLSAWRWQIRVENRSATTRRVDAMLAHDLGLGDEAAVRNNEAYTSQYLDYLPLEDAELGWILLVRQNQPMHGGHHPWLGLACASRATAFCTDATQFFGSGHRLTGQPTAPTQPYLPSKRLQYEAAMAALQSAPVDVAPGDAATLTFVARLVEDHPAASSAADAAVIHEVMNDFVPAAAMRALSPSVPASVFVSAPWAHGDPPARSDLEAWFPGTHRHVETDANGRVLSFFCDDATHVVTQAKEEIVARPHGHVLRSGDASWIDDGQFGLTAYAAGIFGAQSYLGNASLARLLPVVRDPLAVIRGSGQRVFVRSGESWHQLGVPSALAMTPGDVRWIYGLGAQRIEARVWCARDLPASFLDLRVIDGPEREFLITHQLALGANEFDQGGRVRVFAAEGWVRCAPEPGSFTAQCLPGTNFALASATADLADLGGDELVYPDHVRRNGPYVVFRTRATRRCGIVQLGSVSGPAALPGLVAAARAEYAGRAQPAEPMALRLRIAGTSDPGVARLNELIPWFNHNAAIHFSAPHGLEQYGGAAWGVRDVTQGSLEWLLAGGHFDVARRMLTAVFAQQYHAGEKAALTGTWPQWFMFPPFQFIQQAHSHGDVCLWPVKALCDYVEASGDLRYPAAVVGYTDPQTFAPSAPVEALWVHCDRMITHLESRFIPGTALVNYGDGDWDDTLQPADPAMRTRMISAWTVGLAYHTLRQFVELCRRAHEEQRATRAAGLLVRIRHDFAARLMPDGVVAGFVIAEPDGTERTLLHPRDHVTGIRYRLLPMTRSILAELFTATEAREHLRLIEAELRYPDGVRLMSEPADYRGGVERLFRRAETAANVGREVGLQYVHAHLRYAEAMAKVGDAERLWLALQTVNPIGLAAVVPQAAPRQANVYFSSSDAAFDDRYEARARWTELRTGRVAVRGGWRLYSSGPGLFLHKVRTCLLGIRESFGDVVIDPVLPLHLDGLEAELEIHRILVRITYRVRHATHGPRAVTINGTSIAAVREANPYRTGGLRLNAAQLATALGRGDNRIEVEL